MKNWGLKKRVLFLAILPTLIMAITLSLYFSYNQVDYIEKSLFQKGQSLVSHLAPACEYGVFSGNHEILDIIISKTFEEKDIRSITITDNYNKTLITRSNTDNNNHSSLLNIFFDNKQINFSSVITSSEINVDDIDEIFETNITSANTPSRVIGHINITLSNASTRTQQLNSLLKSFLITFAGLIITAFLAVRISRSVIHPLEKLTTAVREIAHGELNTKIDIDSGGEIGSLENSVNIMNQEIQLIRKDLQTQIDKATSKLQKTLDELEIQNIELDLARNQAISASRIKSEFLANMSHEIRTPMNGVLGFTDLLTKTKLTHQQEDFVNTINSSASSLLTIINDILDFSKIESGKLNIDNISFNLPSVIDEIISMFAPMAYKNDIELIYHPYPKIPEILIGDPARIRQILINLIGNAIKFTPKGHVAVRIIASSQTNEHIGLKITISDSGIGMDTINKQRLFTAFTQADTSISRKFGGTGLGLVISKKLAELMGGDIGFDSIINKGSTFWLSIPLTIDQDIQKIEETIINTNNKSIILFESLTQNRIATRAMLDNFGISTIEINRIEKAPELLNTLGKDNICAIIAGINRSDINNSYLINNISYVLKNSKLPHLVITSTFESSELETIKKADINNIISRCSNKDIWKKCISNILDSDKNIESNIENQTSSTDSATLSWKHIHILIVDDNEINLKLAKILLENRGIKVTTAYDGEEAIDLTNKNLYDLILMDLHMPKIDGFQATEHIRKTNNPCSQTSIIALTANAIIEEQIHAYDSGMNDILLKPITEKELFNTLKRWLQPSSESTDITSIEKEPHTEDEDSLEVHNENTGIELAGGNKQLANELFAMLIKELPTHRKEIKNAQKDKDLTKLKNHTHKLHGATSYCGVPALRTAAKTFEGIIDDAKIEELEKYYVELISAIDELVDYYEKRFGQES